MTTTVHTDPHTDMTTTSGVRQYSQEDEPQTALRSAQTICHVLAVAAAGLSMVFVVTAAASFAAGDHGLWWLLNLGLTLGVCGGGFALAGLYCRGVRYGIGQTARTVRASVEETKRCRRAELQEIKDAIVEVCDRLDDLEVSAAHGMVDEVNQMRQRNN